MRKAAYFLLILLTGYVAGMYANPALMVLTAAQLLLAAGMAAQPRYFLRHLTFSAPRGTAVAEQGEACQVRLTVKNDGHMPVGRIRLEILGEFQNLTVTREKFTGACAQGETILQIPVSTEHCGILLSQAARVTVYDYLSLFRKKKKTDLSWKTLIFPGEYSLNLRFSDGGAMRAEKLWKFPRCRRREVMRSVRSGNTGREIRSGISTGIRRQRQTPSGSGNTRRKPGQRCGCFWK